MQDCQPVPGYEGFFKHQDKICLDPGQSQSFSFDSQVCSFPALTHSCASNTSPQMFEKLMPHQRLGVAWMWKLFKSKTGGVLGDDMVRPFAYPPTFPSFLILWLQGLGKTVQVSSFIYGLFCSGTISKVLIIVPLAVMDNWARELAKWAPKVRVVQYHGTQAQRREALAKAYTRGGVVMTTYGTRSLGVSLTSH